MPAPRPADGQLVLDVHSCGICGSDLHAKDHGDELADVLDEVGYHDCIRSGTPTVMGHEFSGEVAERGAKTRSRSRSAPGWCRSRWSGPTAACS